MAQSTYKDKLTEKQSHLVDLLIRHVSHLTPEEPNYRIAEEFIWSNLQAHSFPDTNENEVQRALGRVQEKFYIHNQGEKGRRIDYLLKKFKQMNLKKEGLSEVHSCVVQFLLLMSYDPLNFNFE